MRLAVPHVIFLWISFWLLCVSSLTSQDSSNRNNSDLIPWEDVPQFYKTLIEQAESDTSSKRSPLFSKKGNAEMGGLYSKSSYDDDGKIEKKTTLESYNKGKIFNINRFLPIALSAKLSQWRYNQNDKNDEDREAKDLKKALRHRESFNLDSLDSTTQRDTTNAQVDDESIPESIRPTPNLILSLINENPRLVSKLLKKLFNGSKQKEKLKLPPLEPPDDTETDFIVAPKAPFQSKHSSKTELGLNLENDLKDEEIKYESPTVRAPINVGNDLVNEGNSNNCATKAAFVEMLNSISTCLQQNLNENQGDIQLVQTKPLSKPNNSSVSTTYPNQVSQVQEVESILKTVMDILAALNNTETSSVSNWSKSLNEDVNIVDNESESRNINEEKHNRVYRFGHDDLSNFLRFVANLVNERKKYGVDDLEITGTVRQAPMFSKQLEIRSKNIDDSFNNVQTKFEEHDEEPVEHSASSGLIDNSNDVDCPLIKYIDHKEKSREESHKDRCESFWCRDDEINKSSPSSKLVSVDNSEEHRVKLKEASTPINLSLHQNSSLYQAKNKQLFEKPLESLLKKNNLKINNNNLNEILVENVACLKAKCENDKEDCCKDKRVWCDDCKDTSNLNEELLQDDLSGHRQDTMQYDINLTAGDSKHNPYDIKSNISASSGAQFLKKNFVLKDYAVNQAQFMSGNKTSLNSTDMAENHFTRITKKSYSDEESLQKKYDDKESHAKKPSLLKIITKILFTLLGSSRGYFNEGSHVKRKKAQVNTTSTDFRKNVELMLENNLVSQPTILAREKSNKNDLKQYSLGEKGQTNLDFIKYTRGVFEIQPTESMSKAIKQMDQMLNTNLTSSNKQTIVKGYETGNNLDLNLQNFIRAVKNESNVENIGRKSIQSDIDLQELTKIAANLLNKAVKFKSKPKLKGDSGAEQGKSNYLLSSERKQTGETTLSSLRIAENIQNALRVGVSLPIYTPPSLTTSKYLVQSSRPIQSLSNIVSSHQLLINNKEHTTPELVLSTSSYATHYKSQYKSNIKDQTKLNLATSSMPFKIYIPNDRNTQLPLESPNNRKFALDFSRKAMFETSVTGVKTIDEDVASSERATTLNASRDQSSKEDARINETISSTRATFSFDSEKQRQDTEIIPKVVNNGKDPVPHQEISNIKLYSYKPPYEEAYVNATVLRTLETVTTITHWEKKLVENQLAVFLEPTDRPETSKIMLKIPEGNGTCENSMKSNLVKAVNSLKDEPSITEKYKEESVATFLDRSNKGEYLKSTVLSGKYDKSKYEYSSLLWPLLNYNYTHEIQPVTVDLTNFVSNKINEIDANLYRAVTKGLRECNETNDNFKYECIGEVDITTKETTRRLESELEHKFKKENSAIQYNVPSEDLKTHHMLSTPPLYVVHNFMKDECPSRKVMWKDECPSREVMWKDECPSRKVMWKKKKNHTHVDTTLITPSSTRPCDLTSPPIPTITHDLDSANDIILKDLMYTLNKTFKVDDKSDRQTENQVIQSTEAVTLYTPKRYFFFKKSTELHAIKAKLETTSSCYLGRPPQSIMVMTPKDKKDFVNYDKALSINLNKVTPFVASRESKKETDSKRIINLMSPPNIQESVFPWQALTNNLPNKEANKTKTMTNDVDLVETMSLNHPYTCKVLNLTQTIPCPPNQISIYSNDNRTGIFDNSNLNESSYPYGKLSPFNTKHRSKIKKHRTNASIAKNNMKKQELDSQCAQGFLERSFVTDRAMKKKRNSMLSSIIATMASPDQIVVHRIISMPRNRARGTMSPGISHLADTMNGVYSQAQKEAELRAFMKLNRMSTQFPQCRMNSVRQRVLNISSGKVDELNGSLNSGKARHLTNITMNLYDSFSPHPFSYLRNIKTQMPETITLRHQNEMYNIALALNNCNNSLSNTSLTYEPNLLSPPVLNMVKKHPFYMMKIFRKFGLSRGESGTPYIEHINETTLNKEFSFTSSISSFLNKNHHILPSHVNTNATFNSEMNTEAIPTVDPLNNQFFSLFLTKRPPLLFAKGNALTFDPNYFTTADYTDNKFSDSGSLMGPYETGSNEVMTSTQAYQNMVYHDRWTNRLATMTTEKPQLWIPEYCYQTYNKSRPNNYNKNVNISEERSKDLSRLSATLLPSVEKTNVTNLLSNKTELKDYRLYFTTESCHGRRFNVFGKFGLNLNSSKERELATVTYGTCVEQNSKASSTVTYNRHKWIPSTSSNYCQCLNTTDNPSTFNYSLHSPINNLSLYKIFELIRNNTKKNKNKKVTMMTNCTESVLNGGLKLLTFTSLSSNDSYTSSNDSYTSSNDSYTSEQFTSENKTNQIDYVPSTLPFSQNLLSVPSATNPSWEKENTSFKVTQDNVVTYPTLSENIINSTINSFLNALNVTDNELIDLISNDKETVLPDYVENATVEHENSSAYMSLMTESIMTEGEVTVNSTENPAQEHASMLNIVLKDDGTEKPFCELNEEVTSDGNENIYSNATTEIGLNAEKIASTSYLHENYLYNISLGLQSTIDTYNSLIEEENSVYTETVGGATGPKAVNENMAALTEINNIAVDQGASTQSVEGTSINIDEVTEASVVKGKVEGMFSNENSAEQEVLEPFENGTVSNDFEDTEFMAVAGTSLTTELIDSDNKKQLDSNADKLQNYGTELNVGAEEKTAERNYSQEPEIIELKALDYWKAEDFDNSTVKQLLSPVIAACENKSGVLFTNEPESVEGACGNTALLARTEPMEINSRRTLFYSNPKGLSTKCFTTSSKSHQCSKTTSQITSQIATTDKTTPHDQCKTIFFNKKYFQTNKNYTYKKIDINIQPETTTVDNFCESYTPEEEVSENESVLSSENEFWSTLNTTTDSCFSSSTENIWTLNIPDEIDNHPDNVRIFSKEELNWTSPKGSMDGTNNLIHKETNVDLNVMKNVSKECRIGPSPNNATTKGLNVGMVVPEQLLASLSSTEALLTSLSQPILTSLSQPILTSLSQPVLTSLTEPSFISPSSFPSGQRFLNQDPELSNFYRIEIEPNHPEKKIMLNNVAKNAIGQTIPDFTNMVTIMKENTLTTEYPFAVEEGNSMNTNSTSENEEGNSSDILSEKRLAPEHHGYDYDENDQNIDDCPAIKLRAVHANNMNDKQNDCKNVTRLDEGKEAAIAKQVYLISLQKNVNLNTSLEQMEETSKSDIDEALKIQEKSKINSYSGPTDLEFTQVPGNSCGFLRITDDSEAFQDPSSNLDKYRRGIFVEEKTGLDIDADMRANPTVPRKQLTTMSHKCTIHKETQPVTLLPSITTNSINQRKETCLQDSVPTTCSQRENVSIFSPTVDLMASKGFALQENRSITSNLTQTPIGDFQTPAHLKRLKVKNGDENTRFEWKTGQGETDQIWNLLSKALKIDYYNPHPIETRRNNNFPNVDFNSSNSSKDSKNELHHLPNSGSSIFIKENSIHDQKNRGRKIFGRIQKEINNSRNYNNSDMNYYLRNVEIPQVEEMPEMTKRADLEASTSSSSADEDIETNLLKVAETTIKNEQKVVKTNKKIADHLTIEPLLRYILDIIHYNDTNMDTKISIPCKSERFNETVSASDRSRFSMLKGEFKNWDELVDQFRDSMIDDDYLSDSGADSDEFIAKKDRRNCQESFKKNIKLNDTSYFNSSTEVESSPREIVVDLPAFGPNFSDNYYSKKRPRTGSYLFAEDTGQTEKYDKSKMCEFSKGTYRPIKVRTKRECNMNEALKAQQSFNIDKEKAENDETNWTTSRIVRWRSGPDKIQEVLNPWEGIRKGNVSPSERQKIAKILEAIESNSFDSDDLIKCTELSTAKKAMSSKGKVETYQMTKESQQGDLLKNWCKYNKTVVYPYLSQVESPIKGKTVSSRPNTLSYNVSESFFDKSQNGTALLCHVDLKITTKNYTLAPESLNDKNNYSCFYYSPVSGAKPNVFNQYSTIYRSETNFSHAPQDYTTFLVKRVHKSLNQEYKYVVINLNNIFYITVELKGDVYTYSDKTPHVQTKMAAKKPSRRKNNNKYLPTKRKNIRKNLLKSETKRKTRKNNVKKKSN